MTKSQRSTRYTNRSRQIFAVNLKGAFIISQEFGKQLLKLGRPGKIIHICSMAAYIAQTNVSIYSTSKAGLLQMTKALSNEWAPNGIQCNCISPGFVVFASLIFLMLI